MSDDARRRIPSIDVLLAAPGAGALVERFGRPATVEALRAAADAMREALASGAAPAPVEGAGWYLERARGALESASVPSLRRVINATGVVIHTNLGRAPLAAEALEAVQRAAAGYTALEYDLVEGRRGSRYDHCVALLRELTGAEDALVVNNNAAALVLALNTLAEGAGVAVSRGELVEIGGGFRVPEILERSGARLVEVGSTNRTRLADYRAAVEEGRASLLLKVHRSNFRVLGFTEEASVQELAKLAAGSGVPLVYDLGSGLLVDAASLGLPPEPLAADALAAGAELVCVSGDKVLGGPQAGIVLGRGALVERLRRNPLCRALRVDKMTLAALEATLRLYRDPERARRAVPVLEMITRSAGALEEEARQMAEALARHPAVAAVVRPGAGAVGGGTFPEVALEGPVVAVEVRGLAPHELARRLREQEPPVVARVADERLTLDPRTLLEGDVEVVVRSVLRVVDEAGGEA